MKIATSGLLFTTLVVAVPAFPAFAQDLASPSDQTNGMQIDSDRVIVSAGISIVPSYIGSSRSSIVPLVIAQGKVSGISFELQGTSLYIDAVPGKDGPGWKLQAGPLLALRLDRNSLISGTQIGRLGPLKKAWEPGAWIGVQKTGVLTSPYDTLSISASYQHDISDAHGSYIISPNIEYDTPLSHRAYGSFSLSADYVGKAFGAYYYDVDSAGSSASGLPVYSGADNAEWKDWNLNGTLAHSLTGDLNHGVALFATCGYARILGAYRRSPIVDLAGSANQWSGAVGVAYIF